MIVALTVAALSLPAAPAVAAGRRDPGDHWTFGMGLWARLGEIGDWLRTTFLADGTPYIDPNGTSNS